MSAEHGNAGEDLEAVVVGSLWLCDHQLWRIVTWSVVMALA